MAKMGNGLSERLKAMNSSRPDREVPVIVTVTSGAEVTALKRTGLKIERTLDSVSAVAGSIDVERIDDLASLDEVQSIEYDGEIWAL